MLLLCTSLASLIAAASQSLPSSPLDRVIALNLHAVTLHQALDSIQARGHVELNFVPSEIDQVSTTITLRDPRITIRRAIDAVLDGSSLHVVVTQTGAVAIVAQRSAGATTEPITTTGTIHGTVVDALTSLPLRYARVTLDGQQATTTSDAGVYRFAAVAPGVSHSLSARMLGYTTLARTVSVASGEDAVVDLPLTKSANQLDRVIVAGTIVPTEEKAIPTPVTVITDSELTLQRPQDIQQIFREAVPSAVGWDQPSTANIPVISVRGSTTLNFGDSQMKVYVDGIELADRNFASIDPSTIARIEVIRGPEAATLYGSAAIDGVMLITTKRGSAGQTHPQISLEASGGTVQSPYGNADGGTIVGTQEYRASIVGGLSVASYSLGGTYTSIGNFAPQAGSSYPSVYGGAHLEQGPWTLDVSGREYVQHYGTDGNPLLASTGFLPDTKPQNLDVAVQNQTFGANLVYAPVTWMRSALTLGVDAVTLDAREFRPTFTTPTDTLLSLTDVNENKTSVGFNTTFSLPVNRTVSGNLTIGIDHYNLLDEDDYTTGASNTIGSIQTDPNQPIGADRNTESNTGYFAQMQLGLYDQLFVTAGVRAEQNSNFGQAIGTPVSPRFGLSYAPSLGDGLVAKFRVSYGEAIKPPAPSDRDSLNSPYEVQRSNARLQPEDQRGWDTGVELVSRDGWSFAATVYDQIARGLIQQVLLPDTGAVPVLQFQNLGRVRNRGVELEAKYSRRIAQLALNYAYTSSRVESLGSLYGGDLEVGDQVLLVPRLTGGATLTVEPFRTTAIAVGAAYVGHWTYYNYFTELACFGGTGPCASSTRAYWEQYPAFVKVNLTITQGITKAVDAFLSVRNIGNSDAYEFSNAVPVTGRITTVGLRCRL